MCTIYPDFGSSAYLAFELEDYVIFYSERLEDSELTYEQRFGYRMLLKHTLAILDFIYFQDLCLDDINKVL